MKIDADLKNTRSHKRIARNIGHVCVSARRSETVSVVDHRRQSTVRLRWSCHDWFSGIIVRHTPQRTCRVYQTLRRLHDSSHTAHYGTHWHWTSWSAHMRLVADVDSASIIASRSISVSSSRSFRILSWRLSTQNLQSSWVSDVTWRRHFRGCCTGLYVFVLK